MGLNGDIISTLLYQVILRAPKLNDDNLTPIKGQSED